MLVLSVLLPFIARFLVDLDVLILKLGYGLTPCLLDIGRWSDFWTSHFAISYAIFFGHKILDCFEAVQQVQPNIFI